MSYILIPWAGGVVGSAVAFGLLALKGRAESSASKHEIGGRR